MRDVIEEVATEFHYLRADEKPGKPKDVGQVIWTKDFPKPKGLEAEAGSAEQDARVPLFRRLKQLLRLWPTSQLHSGTWAPCPLTQHG
eukprot:16430340-Heterocapsa_arctica.AAC.1